MATLKEICRVCKSNVNRHDKWVICSICELKTHHKCLPTYTKEDIEYTKLVPNTWSCPSCFETFFPYGVIETTNKFYDNINASSDNDRIMLNIPNLIYDPIDQGEDNATGTLDDIDPEKNIS